MTKKILKNRPTLDSGIKQKTNKNGPNKILPVGFISKKIQFYRSPLCFKFSLVLKFSIPWENIENFKP